MIPTNFLAVLVAAIAGTAVGFLWYGPIFGATWSRLMKITPEQIAKAKAQGGMGGKYFANFVAAFVMAYVLAQSIMARPFLTSGGASVLAFWIWLGFIATVLLPSVLWEGKSWKLYWLSSLYYLVSLLVMAQILLSWR